MSRTPKRRETADRVSGGRRIVRNPLEGLNTRLTYRTMRVIQVIAARPGLSNYEISQRAGVSDQGQISKLLGRLARLGLLENTGDGQAMGLPNAWQLTPAGLRVEAAIAREIAPAWQSPGPGS